MALLTNEVTLPAEGEIVEIPVHGKSVIILDSNTYSSLAQSPKLFFDNRDNTTGVPTSIVSQFQYDKPNGFSKIIVESTSESEGNTMAILSTRECLPTKINEGWGTGELRRVLPGTSFTRALNDVTDNFTEVDLLNSNGLLPTKIIVSVRGGDAVWLIDPNLSAVPAQNGGNGLGTVLREPDTVDNIAGDLLEVDGLAFILSFRFRARVTGETPELTVHLEY